MPYLIVLGNGSWRYRDHTYKAGVHEVSEELADAARRAPVRSLVVMNRKPVVVQKTPGPLTLADLKRPRRMGVALTPDAVPQLPVEDDYEVPLDYPCDKCDEMFPSAGARDRHLEFNHPR